MPRITVTETTTTTTGLPPRHQPHHLSDPPPYTPPAHGVFPATGTPASPVDDEYDDDGDSQTTTHFVIQAPTTVHGSSNIVALPPPDVARITAALVATLGQKTGLPRNFSIQINCGVNVIGDKNIVGSPAIRPLAASQQQQATTTLATRHGVQQQQGVGGTARVSPTASAALGGGGVRLSMREVGKRRASEELENAPMAKKQTVYATAGSRSSSP